MKSINFASLDNEVTACADLSKPSKEDYEASKEALRYFRDCLRLSRNRQNELLDQLCEERSSEKMYLEMYQKHNEITRRYEIYEELESNG